MSLSEKKKELINLLHEDKLTQFGKEQIEAIIVNQQKEKHLLYHLRQGNRLYLATMLV